MELTPTNGPSGALSDFKKRIDISLQEDAGDYLDSVSFSSSFDLATPYLRSLAGGKRLRALCAVIGAATELGREHQATAEALLTEAASQSSLLALGRALELYQASALVHDDLLDSSPLRRGQPTAHVYFQTSHGQLGLLGERQSFGRAGAVLLGNLLTAAAESALADAIEGNARAALILRTYARMTGEVAVGQAADTAAPFQPLEPGDVERASDSVEQAIEVVKRKSARYSVVYPTVLGALLFGAQKDSVDQLWRILEPAGIAFQLRDDELGVFGEDEVTGKPTGLDIVEGKRTVLLALTLEHCSPAERTRLAEIYASSQPSPAQVKEATSIMAAHGRERHSDLINAYREEALRAAEQAQGFGDSGKDLLASLVHTLVDRDS